MAEPISIPPPESEVIEKFHDAVLCEPASRETVKPYKDDEDFDPREEGYGDDSFDEYNRPAERWAPLGAAAAVSLADTNEDALSCFSEDAQLKKLEEEQEQLNSSLLALTTHFAQVQFRLKQIVAAPNDTKEDLLKELEEFAFRGIPDVRGCHIEDALELETMSDKEHTAKINEQRQKQTELIEQLKNQLEDLEMYAYETGGEQLPTSKVLEKQKVVIDRLRHKLHVDLEDMDRLTTDELKSIVDNAIGQIVNPARVKEKLVDQLKTQITDLERFIEFLQGEATSPGPLGATMKACTCSCPMHGQQPSIDITKFKKPIEKRNVANKVRDQTLTIMKRALTILQIFAISQFGCGGQEFQRNLMKRTTKGNHYGDLLARLEIAIVRVRELAKKESEHSGHDSDYTSDSEEVFVANPFTQELMSVVRKELAPALRDLIHHGLMEMGQSTGLVPWGCLPKRSAKAQKMMHAWDLFMKYYELKNGREYNESPARKLSQSFDLDIVGGKAITAKQTLLGAIDSVIATHNPLKRSEDSKLKAFICLGLNEKKLSTWLRLVLKNTTIVDYFYQPWSYTAKTGFEDALKSLSLLNHVNFNLPMDISVRKMQNIKDAF
ncbi:RUN domain-containing protein 1-like isoform X2 [Lineus longissimus]|uniref:RUN domain-containing protein 1-like isoform X2 n=1 Tax=Lineus longissimus TaxID=88925 RepID=UPI00315D5454